jgi:cytochrome c oxidase cbb3-type subunit 2
MYDHPFQWGSKRTGPDLARVGNRYSNEWHVAHMINPRSLVPESVMPGYPFLATTPLKLKDIRDHLKANRTVGVPYTDEMIKTAKQDLMTQANPEAGDADALKKRYPGARANFFDDNPAMVTEMDAIISYLQVLGTMVDLKSFKAKGENLR